jgi:hypothetical protein
MKLIVTTERCRGSRRATPSLGLIKSAGPTAPCAQRANFDANSQKNETPALMSGFSICVTGGAANHIQLAAAAQFCSFKRTDL